MARVPRNQGTWWRAICSLFLSVLLLLSVRWLVFEPYVIPSSSMVPTLLELDFIYVNKFAYGLRLPFSSRWLFQRSLPKRCEVVVFRSQTVAGQFLVKRVIGLPGETVEVLRSGHVRINGQLLATKSLESADGVRTWSEACSTDGTLQAQENETHFMRTDALSADDESVEYTTVVPAEQLLMLGDNRHHSADSRVWGTLPRSELLGKVLGIWLSCDEALPDLQRVCDPRTLRGYRMFKAIDHTELPLSE